MNKRIVLTGGGTAGHVTPNIALMDLLQAEGFDVHYIGSVDGVEQSMISALHLPFYPIQSGKLRRYFSWKNFLDPAHILIGIVQSFRILRRLRPQIVFSKGGFVAFPVVVGAWLNRIPVIVHESDMSPGLANRLSFPFASKICVTFSVTKSRIKQQDKVDVTGTPIRKQLLLGSRDEGLQLCGFHASKPCLLVIGGSLGAQAINVCVREALDKLTSSFQVIHVCGKGKLDEHFKGREGYCQFEYVNDGLADLFAASDVVVARAGANSVCEILAQALPHVFIPLSERVSRGDQVQNARFFQKQGISVVVSETELTPETLTSAVNDVYAHRQEITEKIKLLGVESAAERIVALIKSGSSGKFADL